MGLDITGYAVRAGASDGTKLHYWCKHPELWNWCKALGIGRVGAAWEEPAQAITLTSADIDMMEAAVMTGELPGTGRGGAAWEEPAQAITLTSADIDMMEAAVMTGELPGTEYWREADLAFIAKAREALAAGLTIEIMFSW